MQAPLPLAAPRDLSLGLRVALASLLWFLAYRTHEHLWNWAIFDALGLDPSSRWGGAVHFFFYDVSKIMLLLVAIIFSVTLLRSFLSVERTRSLLGGRRSGVAVGLAALLGAATPFCTCSVVPAFIGFLSAGVPLAATLTFLIASPMVDLVALTLLYSLFGAQLALLYLAAGLGLAIVAGTVLGRLRLERFIEPFVFETHVPVGYDPAIGLRWRDRVNLGIEEVKLIVGRIWPFVLVGIGLGAGVHGWVPEDFFARVAGPENVLAVPTAVLLGVPLYTSIVGVVPLAAALQAKGLAMGTVLAFMMSTVALSLPGLILLRRVLKLPLIAIFVAVVASGIIALGMLFNALL
jgi:uncharacterized membrane protein YraQ (UPF0718 family)